jgi:DNA-directed RNA polymerase specialized sigma24 family protein
VSSYQSWDAPHPHQEIFVERYGRLRGWALHLSRGDHGEADDLLHNAFLQFVVRRRELSEIDNLEGYLFGLLRRLRLSSARTALNRRHEPLSAVDYDAAALCLTDADAGPLQRMQVAQELDAVCEYACRRKDTSKAGSVLILRFFHGYYPKEIARILRSPLRLANDWLRIARREARAFLLCPPAAGAYPEPAADSLQQLRTRIEQAKTGSCLTLPAVERLYHADATASVSSATLAHIVSCPACLQLVTAHLNLEPYADRDPRDMLGPDDGHRGNENRTRTTTRNRVIAGAAIALALWTLLPWRGTTAMASELLRAAHTLLIRIESVVRELSFRATKPATTPAAVDPPAIVEPAPDADRPVTHAAPPPLTIARGRSPAATVEAHNRLEIDALFAEHRLEAPQAAAAVTGTSAWMIESSSAALREARELERLTTAWTPQRLWTLDADRAAMWLDVVRDHARRFRRESEEARRSLESAFGVDSGPPSTPGQPPGVIPSAAETRAVVSRLVALAVSHELTLRTAAPTAGDAEGLARSLRAAELESAWFDQPLLLER